LMRCLERPGNRKPTAPDDEKQMRLNSDVMLHHKEVILEYERARQRETADRRLADDFKRQACSLPSTSRLATT